MPRCSLAATGEHLGIGEGPLVVSEMKGLVAVALSLSGAVALYPSRRLQGSDARHWRLFFIADGGSPVRAGSLYRTELEANSSEHFLP